MTELGIGIVGSGFMGRIYAETAAKYLQGAGLRAIAVGSRAAGLAQDYGVAFEPDLMSLLARPDIDAVVITTPETVHLEQVRLAAAAGKHVLVEKPMAPDLAQCDAMIETCAQAGIIYMQVQSQRYRPIHRRVRQLIDEGRIGEVWQVHVYSMIAAQWSQAVVDARPWYTDPAGGGLIMSQVVHNFDMLRWIAGGNASRVFAHARTYGARPLHDLSLQAQVVFDNGVSGQLWVCMETPGVTFPLTNFRTQVIGSKGLLDFDGFTHLDLGTPDGKWQRVMEQGKFTQLNQLNPIRIGSFFVQTQEFVDAIREQRSPAVTAADGRAAVELCQAALLSSRTGRLIELPLVG